MQAKESAGLLHSLSGGAWDPHDYNAIALTCDSSVQFWDLRSMKYANFMHISHCPMIDTSAHFICSILGPLFSNFNGFLKLNQRDEEIVSDN